MRNASSDGMVRKAPLDDAETSLGDSGELSIVINHIVVRPNVYFQ